ncbi:MULTISPECIES: thiol-disulfide oxidoreductase DCC family protein [Corallincola]|uniref:DUF393 domain-containing protein n=2 Tax=Corallincola TaxID=1775176 RepID=A0ABY1WUF1_9GAMM|nr:MULTISPECIES: DUF393 domain-containing protein [Corallincola]TAA48358.1 DUF393 domain-containing protein [Corallincola spongiicola]TCI02345.1 DUF393 domain-containing protein [Corallincola luteus]
MSIQATAIETLYFDGRCAMCSREIAFLKRHADSEICFVDIHAGVLPDGSDKQAMLEVLHMQDADGGWRMGIDATLLAWSHTPFSWIVSPLKIGWLRPLFETCYAKWAKRRYCRLYMTQAKQK